MSDLDRLEEMLARKVDTAEGFAALAEQQFAALVLVAPELIAVARAIRIPRRLKRLTFADLAVIDVTIDALDARLAEVFGGEDA